MKIIIFTTNEYPKYEKTEEVFKSEADALNRFEELSSELIKKVRCGELQDYELTLI